jgi:hypothetical protein
VTFIAVRGGFEVKGVIAVMTGAAEIAFRELAHIHLVLAARHGEWLVVTVVAPNTLEIDVVFVLKENAAGAFGFVFHIAAADLCIRSHRCEKQEKGNAIRQNASHDLPYFLWHRSQFFTEVTSNDFIPLWQC